MRAEPPRQLVGVESICRERLDNAGLRGIEALVGATDDEIDALGFAGCLNLLHKYITLDLARRITPADIGGELELK